MTPTFHCWHQQKEACPVRLPAKWGSQHTASRWRSGSLIFVTKLYLSSERRPVNSFWQFVRFDKHPRFSIGDCVCFWDKFWQHRWLWGKLSIDHVFFLVLGDWTRYSRSESRTFWRKPYIAPTQYYQLPPPCSSSLSSSSSIMHLLYQGHRFWKKMWQQKNQDQSFHFPGPSWTIARSVLKAWFLDEKKLLAICSKILTEDHFINWSKGNTRTESLLWFLHCNESSFFPSKN